MRLGSIGVVVSICVLAGCTTAPLPTPQRPSLSPLLSPAISGEASPNPTPPSPSPPPTATPSLSLATPLSSNPTASGPLVIQNRGGPTIELQINGAVLTDVACGQWPTIEPASLPPLPWHLVVVRKDSGGTIWSGDVTDLPAYFLQLGPDGTLSTVYPMGPPGPVCPTDLASPLPGQMAYLLLRLNVRFWPLTADQLAQVTVTAAQAAQTAYDSIGGQIPGSSTCEFLGLFMNATPGGPSPSITRPAYLVLTVGRRDSNFTDARMQFVDAVTGQLLHSYSPDANTASQFGYNCGPQPA